MAPNDQRADICAKTTSSFLPCGSTFYSLNICWSRQ